MILVVKHLCISITSVNQFDDLINPLKFLELLFSAHTKEGAKVQTNNTFLAPNN